MPWQTIISALVAAGAALAVISRYVLKVERSFADQRVINERHIAASEKLLLRIDNTDSRVDHLERIVAPWGVPR